MSTGAFFTQAFVYLAAAVIAVPLAKRLGLGSVLGYLLAGIVIGPAALGFVGAEGEEVMHFAEFGVVMMLFVIGLELHPSRLWKLRVPILGLGGTQVALTTGLATGIAIALGVEPRPALAIGMIVALSSTAIVLQTLAEKGLLQTGGGQSAFAVLLFQDIAVIPMLALMPLLASPGMEGAGEYHAAETLLSAWPAWARALAVIGAVTGIVAGGRYLLRPLLRSVARVRMREIFTAAALMLVIGIALLMEQVGLSPALGTFLAGVVLANSEYRHELEANIEPFKGLLLGLFFIAVGASIDFELIASTPAVIVALTLAMIALKLTVLLGLARVYRLPLDQALLFAFALPQVGEFSFVLLSFARQERVLTAAMADPLVAAVALSMAVTPILLVLNERFLQPRFGTRREEEHDPDPIEESNPVIIAGFGGFGSTVGRLLNSQGIGTTVLEHDSERVELLRRMGQKVYYGDAARADLLEAAGAAEARLIVLAVDDSDLALRIAKTVQRLWPHLTIYARARGWVESYAFYGAGVEHVYREPLDTSLRVGTDVLQALGVRAYQAERAAQKMLRYEIESLRYLAVKHAEGEERYISAARERLEALDALLSADRERVDLGVDDAWDPRSLIEDFSTTPPTPDGEAA